MKRWMSGLRVLMLAWLCTASVGFAQATGGSTDTCPDSGFYSKGKAVSDLCWNCFFPIVIAGQSVSGSDGDATTGGFGAGADATGSGLSMSGDFGSRKRGKNKLPDRKASPLCVCPGRTMGYPSPGITWGMWFPTHSMEMTRKPWCSPILFGEKLGSESMTNMQSISVAAMDGGPSTGAAHPADGAALGGFYNWHWITFPGYEIMEYFMESLCSPGGMGGDFSYLYFTEFDPTWDNEMLALYTHPEVKVFTSLYARAACMADSVMSTVNKPIEAAMWCAGTWGSLYPYSGKFPVNATVEAQMLLGARGLAAMHRRGLAKLTYTDRAVCTDAFWFVYPKQQYQFQNMWPVPQKKNANWTGQSSWTFGQHRKKPVVGEERVLMQWTFSECCYTLY